MKRLIFSISTFCLLAALAGGYIYMQEEADNTLAVAHTQNNSHAKKVLDRAQSYIGAHEYLLAKKANPATGRVDASDILKAREAADKLSESRVEKSGNINWEFMGPNNVGGRTRAIMIDKDNTDRMIAGGVAGGLFISTNGGLSWEGHPQNTSFSSLAVSAITQAPNGDIYVGTGEYIDSGIDFGNGKSGGSKIPGNGVYKSTDGGATFQLLESTIPSISNGSQTADDWLAVQDIETSPTNSNLVYACTTRGLQISQDGGATWTKAQGVSSISIAYDIAIADNGTAHLVAENRYYRADDGLNFSDEFTGNNTPGKFELSSRNKVLAMSPSDNNYLYIVTITSTGCLRKVWQSKNGGNTWLIIGEGSGVFFDPMSQNGGGSCQGWYDLCVEVDPANKERIIVGGITLWSWSARDSWNQLDGGNFNSPYYVHADKHTILFHPTEHNKLFVGHDGGISRSIDAQEVFPTFSTINKNYIVTQFYGMAAGIDGRVVGGTQDNSTIFVTMAGSSAFEGEFITGGDGGFCDVSKLNPLGLFAESQNGAIVRTGSGTPPLGPFFDTNIDCNPDPNTGACDPDGEMDGNPLFITPFILWEDILGNLISGEENSKFVTGSGDGKVWMTEGALKFSEIPLWRTIADFAGARTVSAVAVSNDGKTVYAGTTDGRMMRVTNLDRDVPTTKEFRVSNTGNQYIASIDIDFNPAHIIVGLGNYGSDQNIVESNNANSANPTFSSIQNNLPLMPVYAVVIDLFNSSRIIAGTELGVWLYDANTKTWTEENGIMGRVPVHSLRFEIMNSAGCEVLYAGTHGRGMYRSTTYTLLGCDTTIDFPDYEFETDIEDFNGQITEVKVFPNPMVTQSKVEITLTETTDLTLRIFDLQGRVVRNEYLGELSAQTHSVEIEKGDLASGTYVMMLSSGSKQISKKLMVQ